MWNHTLFWILVFHCSIFSVDCLLKKRLNINNCTIRPITDSPKVNISLKADHKNHPIFVNENHFQLPSLHSGTRREFVFECNATYPVEWVSQSPPVQERIWTVQTRRYANVSVVESYIYSAKLTISSKTAKEIKQTCRSVDDKACLQTTIIAKKSGTTNNQTWMVTINYSDPIGIILKDYDSPIGRNPNCSISLTYDPQEKTFCCQSKKEVNLTISEVEPFCNDPTSCRQLYSESSCNKQLHSFAQCPENSYTLSPPSERESPTTQAGVLECHADGRPHQVSAAVHYFYSLPALCESESKRLPTLYFNWFDAKLFEFVSMCPLSEPIYVGEKRNFTCVASLYYTAAGMQFLLKRKDEHGEDEEYLEYVSKNEVYDTERGTRTLSREIKINDTSITSIDCLAPVRNSSTWITREVHLTILEPTAISFDDGDAAFTKIYDDEEFTLTCHAHGNPRPTLMWLRSGNDLQSLSKRLNITIVSDENSEFRYTEIQFPLYDDPRLIYGEYTCRAKNKLEYKDKIFIVLEKPGKRDEEVLEETSTNTLFYLKAVVLPIAVIVIVLIFGFLVWKILQQTRKLRSLTHAEIDEFMHGKPDIVKKCRESNYEINSYANCLPYNKKYEILKEQLEIDEHAILGTGAYGMVLKGTYTNKSFDKSKVAIKTVKPMDDISYFKALLSELKIMAFIGKHVNIINLIGAYTTNIEKREIYIATEFCENGNVLSFLKRNRKNFTNLVSNGQIVADSSFSRASYRSSVTFNTISTITLLKWSTEIANGMDFLGKKKVIHGDLAARNVFITGNLVVKIGDFGLSKQLFEYANYIKKNQSPLPWKWLAIECLQDMQFSVSSDVWAFGITLWEIFSLGLSPYLGCMYNEEFVRNLVSGTRPSKPQYAPDNVYDEMIKCWNIETTLRPTFKHLKAFFDEILKHLVAAEYLELEDKEPVGDTVVITLRNDTLPRE